MDSNHGPFHLAFNIDKHTDYPICVPVLICPVDLPLPLSFHYPVPWIRGGALVSIFSSPLYVATRRSQSLDFSGYHGNYHGFLWGFFSYYCRKKEEWTKYQADILFPLETQFLSQKSKTKYIVKTDLGSKITRAYNVQVVTVRHAYCSMSIAGIEFVESLDIQWRTQGATLEPYNMTLFTITKPKVQPLNNK